MRTKKAWPPAVTSDQHRGCAQQVLSRNGHKTDPELVLYGLRGLSCLRIVVPRAPHWMSQVRPRQTVTSVIGSQLLRPGSPCLHQPTTPSSPDFAFPWKACLRVFFFCLECTTLVCLWLILCHLGLSSNATFSWSHLPLNHSFLHGPYHKYNDFFA